MINNKKAIYAGSFDLLTLGHLWIIKEAASIFDQVIVTIGNNAQKNYMFSIDKRYEFLKETLSNFKNVQVAKFENELLVDFAKSVQANYLIRGIRNSNDFEYEKQVHYVNLDASSDKSLSTIFLIPPPQYSYISSTLVKGLVGLKGWENIIEKYVPKETIIELKRLLSHK